MLISDVGLECAGMKTLVVFINRRQALNVVVSGTA